MTPARFELYRAVLGCCALVPYALVAIVLPPRQWLLALAVVVPAHLLLQVLGSALAGLRPATIEIGVGRVVATFLTPLGLVEVRWLPIRLAFDCWPNSLHRAKFRLWFPHFLAFLPYPSTFILSLINGWRAAAVVSLVGLLSPWLPLPLFQSLPSSGQRLRQLPRADAAGIRARCAPFTDARVRRLNNEFRYALARGDRPVAVLSELEALPAAEPLLDGYRAMVSNSTGDFVATAELCQRQLDAGTVRPDSTRALLADSVFSAVEADQPVTVDMVASARSIVRADNPWPVPYQALLEARLALYDRDLPRAIEWAERSLRWSTSRDLDSDALLTLALAYGRLGWRRDAERALARARRRVPRAARLPYVSRAVAASLGLSFSGLMAHDQGHE